MKLLDGLLFLGLATVAANAQMGRGGSDWMTAGNDAQRSFWVRSDAKISPDNLRKPGFDFIWKVGVDPAAKQALGAPMLLDRYIGYRGFRSLAFFGATGDKVVGVDTDLGRVEWRQQLPASSSAACAGAAVAVTRPTTTAFSSQQAGGGGMGRRGGPAHSAAGEPLEGAVTIRDVSANMAGPGGPGGRRGAPDGPGRGPAGPGGPPPGFGRMPSVLNVVTRDGMMHSVYVSNGEPSQPAVRFAPANANLAGLIVAGNVAYAAAGEGCDAAPTEVLALDLESKNVVSFRPDAGDIAGTHGFALGPDGTLYIATTAGDLVALEPKTLKRKGSYKAGQPFATSPVVFQHDDKAWIAAGTKDGRVHVLDAADMISALAVSEPMSSAVSALATWEDSSGTRWLLGPTTGSIVAWKLAGRNIQPGWTSRDLGSPLAPAIVNGVAFTASSGTSPVVYALDASTGRELWNSGRKIASPIRGGGLSAGNSQVYLGSNDGTVYVFGFPMEH
jgi:outer membrane protein assembly factor BamB